MRSLEVCLSPDFHHLYQFSKKIVVVNDIFRATSCIVTGIANGVPEIVPFHSLEECKKQRAKGYKIAAEREGQKVDGFDLGNSPFDYILAGKNKWKIAATTTNGTKTINLSKEADHVLIGAFLNISAIANHIKKLNQDVVIFCSGWKGKPSLEDTLFAGSLVQKLQNEFTSDCDASLIAKNLYQAASNNLTYFLKAGSHYKRLSTYGVQRDIKYILKLDKYQVVPILKDGKIISM